MIRGARAYDIKMYVDYHDAKKTKSATPESSTSLRHYPIATLVQQLRNYEYIFYDRWLEKNINCYPCNFFLNTENANE